MHVLSEEESKCIMVDTQRETGSKQGEAQRDKRLNKGAVAPGAVNLEFMNCIVEILFLI